MTPAEVSKLLGISSSTLRKYCLLLEQHGIEFERNANNSRKYTEVSVIALQKLITLLNRGDMTVESAASVIGIGERTKAENMHKTEDSTVTHNAVERHNDDITGVMLKEIMSLKEEIQEQKEVIDGFRVAQEQRDKYFVEILEQLQGKIDELNEQKALPEVAATEQEEKPQKKGFFNRFFK